MIYDVDVMNRMFKKKKPSDYYFIEKSVKVLDF